MQMTFVSIFKDTLNFIKNSHFIFLFTLIMLFLIKWGFNVFFMPNSEILTQFMNEMSAYLNIESALSFDDLQQALLQMPTESIQHFLNNYVSPLIITNMTYLIISLTAIMVMIHLISTSQTITPSSIFKSVLPLFFRHLLMMIIFILVLLVLSTIAGVLGNIGFILLLVVLLMIFGLAPAIMCLDAISATRAILRSTQINFKNYAILLPLYLFYIAAYLLISLIFISYPSASIVFLLIYNILSNAITFFALIFLYRFYSLYRDNHLQHKTL